ncbi:twin-arginine translocase subunit TatC, partial [Dysgonomonas sp. OttesenSCG-928-M03]|nr:twin-arginine translocase subunit TatC [Dysgonomonas sp. OttesenSCG-928-M03]
MGKGQDLTFLDHLEDLRWMLLRSLIAVFIFAIISFIAMPYIYDEVVMGPTRSDFFLYEQLCFLTSNIPFIPNFCDNSFHVDIININLASQFFRHMSTSFWLALIMTFPYLVYEVWRFVNPALYSNEKGKVRIAFIFGTAMFFLGCLLGYSIIFPITFRFLSTYQLSPDIKNQISLDSYMDNFLMMIFIMGVMFELPLVAWLASRLGLLTRAFFKRYRRHAIVILLVVAAFITPSGDPFTLIVVFLPLYILYEISYLLVRPEDPEAIDADNS